MDFKDKKAVVCGAGISGIGALSLLNDLGAILYVYDEKKSLTELEEAVKDFNDIKTAVGDFPNEWINECDVMILSPGIPGDKDFVIEFKNLGKYIIGEVELAFQCSKGKLIAITGTNGKTTTTALVGEMLENYFKSSFVVGNIGYAYTTKVSEMKDESVTVAEISSFQMEWIDTFHPNVSCILNLTEDHLDRHKTMENYVSCKLNVNANQNDDEVIVLNYDDEETKKVLDKIHGQKVFFSSRCKLQDGYYLKDRVIYFAKDGNSVKLLTMDDMNIVGNHNAENVMAAIALATQVGVPMDIIIETIKDFKAVAHRVEFVRELNGVKYYDDSKGTNPDATIKAVEAMDGPVILFAGGYDKEVPFDKMAESFVGKVKLLILLAQTREKIKEAALKVGITNIILVENYYEAVKVAQENVQSGDCVLLSPACASWGMFDNYKQRGDLFKKLVNELK